MGILPLKSMETELAHSQVFLKMLPLRTYESFSNPIATAGAVSLCSQGSAMYVLWQELDPSE